MTFEKAIHSACIELGYDSHIKEIKYKKDAHSYAEKIALNFKKPPFGVKNSYMYLDGVDFCLFQVNGECDFSISGYVHGNDKIDIINAIDKVLRLCELTTAKMAESEDEEMMDWITEENPEEENVYLVTWRGKLWKDSYLGLCEWNGTNWMMEEFEPHKKYKGENIIITAWSDIEPYKDR